MGGAFDGVGNVHRVGEFNIWADPEAAKVAIDADGTIGSSVGTCRAVML